MNVYLQLLNELLVSGNPREDRTGTGTLSLFGYQMRVDLSSSFPLLTTKRLHIPSIVHELLWFIKGDTNVAYLQERGVRIWNEWADESGDLGPVYGAQWRSWRGADGAVHDQLLDVIGQIRSYPYSRRLLVCAWNVADIPHMALAPCHCLFQFYVQDGTLSCQLYQRSADAFLGVPFNIASYALLTAMVAQVCGLRPKELVHTFGDVHLYTNHLEQAREQLSRAPLELPTLRLNPSIEDIEQFRYEDISFEGYAAHPHIPAMVSI